MLLVLGVCVGHPGILIIFPLPAPCFITINKQDLPLFGSSLLLFFSDFSLQIWICVIFLTSVIFKQCVQASVCIITENFV